VYLQAFDEVVGPFAESFGATWLVVSCGFDAHRDDPVTDLDALSRSAAACVAVLAGADYEAEPTTSDGPGREVVDEAKEMLD
jgi:acetoin utilization deacetylase AcuC-like enzyme